MDHCEKSSKGVDNTPDFKRITDYLAEIRARADMNYNALRRVANYIKHPLENESDPYPGPKEPTSLVEQIWSELFLLSNINSDMEKTIRHVTDTIGSGDSVKNY